MSMTKLEWDAYLDAVRELLPELQDEPRDDWPEAIAWTLSPNPVGPTEGDLAVAKLAVQALEEEIPEQEAQG